MRTRNLEVPDLWKKDGEKDGGKETGPKSRAKILINRYDPDTGERKDRLPSETVSEVDKVQDSSHAFVLRKNLDASPKEDNDSELEVISRNLWNLLKSLLSHDPYHTFESEPVTLCSPFEPLILNWDELAKAAKEDPVDDKDMEARLDLKLLLDTISAGSGDTKLEKYFKVRDSYREQGLVTFEMLWTIFPPGAMVYGRPFQGEEQIFLVKDNIRIWPRSERRGESRWSLICWTYDWNGKAFKRLSLRLDFDEFEGHKPITSLSFYPLQYVQHFDVLKKRLVERGTKYKSLCTAKQGFKMFDYEGEVMFFGKKGFSESIGEDDEVSASNRHLVPCL